MAAPLRFLLRALGFSLFCMALYPLLLTAMGALLPNEHAPNIRYPLNSYGHQRTRMQEVIRHLPVDIVFLGSSHAYRGFDPRIWAKRGYRTFNLGSSAQSPLQTELVVDAHVPGLKPRLAIMEVHPSRFSDPGIESALDFIANRPIDRHTVRMALRLPDVLIWNALAYGLVRQCSGFDERMPEPLERKQDRYVAGGFVERRAGHFRPRGWIKPEAYEPLDWQEQALARVLENLKRQGVAVILVEAPVTRWFREGSKAQHAPFEAYIAQQRDYIDMNGKVELDDSLHFFTKGHLNQAGVELFNEALIDTLQRRGWLPPPGAAAP